MDRNVARVSYLWHGIRLRPVAARPDPDATPRTAWIPFAWDDAAADALCELAGDAPARLDTLADAWLRPLPTALAAELHALLLTRRVTPLERAWHGEPDGFGLNLARFHEPGFGVDGPALTAAARAIAAAQAYLGGRALALCDLDGLLALERLDYGSAAARTLAVDVVGRIADMGPSLCARLPGAAEALLGAESGGVAPAFSPLRPDGGLSRAAQARIAAAGMTTEAALAAVLAGTDLFVPPSDAARAAMHDVLSPLMTLPKLRPVARPRETRRELPAHPAGIARRVTIGGQRVFLRTGDYADGQPGEVTVTLPQASPIARGWADAFGHVLSLGLRHGVPVEEVALALANTRFGPAGAVEGDGAIRRATSPADYLARALAAAYAPALALPEPEPEFAEEPPLLPLEIPRLRLVK